jgi:hypothetical protein
VKKDSQALLFCEQKRTGPPGGKKNFDLLRALAMALPQPTVSKSFLVTPSGAPFFRKNNCLAFF